MMRAGGVGSTTRLDFFEQVGEELFQVPNSTVIRNCYDFLCSTGGINLLISY